MRRTPRGRTLAIFAVLVGLLAGAGLAARLFLGGPIGLSDQGDGLRLLCNLNVRSGVPYGGSTMPDVYLTWYPHHWYGENCGAFGSGEPYQSSQLSLLYVAKWLTPGLGLPGALDLRAVGVVMCVLVALLFALLMLVLPGSAIARLVAAIALWLVVADGGFAGYFVSPYSEPAGFIGMFALLIAVVLFWRTERVRWWSLLLLAATSAFSITAKSQMASVVFCIVPLVMLRATWGGSIRSHLHRRYGRFARVSRSRRLPAIVITRWPGALLSALLIVLTQQYLAHQPHRFEVLNRYSAVFIEMLPHSPNPKGDLKQLGLPTDMVSSSGISIIDPRSVAATPEFEKFLGKASPLSTTLVYVEHPTRFIGLIARGLRGMTDLRPSYLGSYPASAHRPYAKECRICVFQTLWKGALGSAPGLILLLVLASVLICWRLARTRQDRRLSAIGVAGLVLAANVIVQFWVVMLTEGANEIVKHMAIADFTSGLLFVVAGYSLYLLRRSRPSAGTGRHVETPAAALPDGQEPVVSDRVAAEQG